MNAKDPSDLQASHRLQNLMQDSIHQESTTSDDPSNTHSMSPLRQNVLNKDAQILSKTVSSPQSLTNPNNQMIIQSKQSNKAGRNHQFKSVADHKQQNADLEVDHHGS